MYKAHARHLLMIAFAVYIVAAILAAVLGLAGAFGEILGNIVTTQAVFVLIALLVKTVQDEREGRRDLSISATVNAALPYLGNVVIASLLAGIAITIGLVLLIAPGLYLITIWAVFIPVIVIEGAGALDSFGRSQQLVRGHGWQVFRTLVLVYIIQVIAGAVLSVIFSALPYFYRDGLSAVVSGTLIAPFLAIVATLIYYRLTESSRVNSGAGYQQPF